MNKKKRNILATSLAVVLAVVLLAGGTFSYFYGESKSVTNNIKAGYNSVSLSESGATLGADDNYVNSSYEIVPGTSAAKDPTVTVNYTLESYVYVVVEDNTNSLVSYLIDDSWEELAGESGVYYRLVSPSDSGAEENTLLSNSSVKVYTQQFAVLENNSISYAPTITNEQMLDSNGKLIDNLSLSFKAYIVQAKLGDYTQDGSGTKTYVNADPADAFRVASTGASYYVAGAEYKQLEAGATNSLGEAVSLETQLANAVSAAAANDSVTVIVWPESSSISISTANLDAAAANDVVFDLNSGTLEVSGYLTSGGTTYSCAANLNSTDELTFANGTVNYTISSYGSGTFLSMNTGSSLTLDNVTVNTMAPINVEAGTEVATLNIIDSTINSSACYCVSTNASNNQTGDSVVINITNSTLTDNEQKYKIGDSAAVLFNVPGTLNITGSTITGERQGVILRAGSANITDSTIATTGEYSGSSYYLNSNWGSGDEVPMAALVVGNRSASVSAYPYAATAKLSNVNLTVGESANTSVPAIYTATNGYATTVTGAAGTDTVLADLTNAANNNNGGSITINSNKLTSGITSLTAVGDLGENS
ncbi:MAG: hypothetical protein LUH82_02925 [Clostridiales bacterium]|nr:hypothetical protein [Clostridiales bacterium]